MATREQLKNAVGVLISALFGVGELIDTHMITEKIDQFRPVLISVYGFRPDDFDELEKILEVRFATTMDAGTALTDDTDDHNEEWYQDRLIEWNYWDDYFRYLQREGWDPRVLQTMDTVTSNILGLLEDPLKEGDWERRGLVIGHVQSGKTANYLGLINKAADAGYKFIIVIAGIHNELRRQTQQRVDRGFIGRDSADRQSIVGVGLIDRSRAVPVTVTTTDSDFNRTTAKNFGVGLDAVSNTFILVIKKNASTLSHLYKWLKELNTRKGFEQITDIPMLLIDDEADNASINTSRTDLSPTRINREIRQILNLFRKKCYVGYTATPFANIFIDPDVNDDKHGADLFPRHFIYSLDAPSNYLGYGRIFLDDEGQHNFIRLIKDADGWLPADHKNDTPIYALPVSMRRAINLFVLARAIRNLREQSEKHTSMLINVSRFVSVQREVKALVDIYIADLKRSVRYNYAIPWEKAHKDQMMGELYESFEEEHSSDDLQWKDILPELSTAAEAVNVVVVNSRSQERLLYSDYNRDGKPLTVIAIGGLSLSRGLTLEGLTISYIHRSTKMYDTLLQMGRWFGYRSGYEDLCRIFMSDSSYEWYAHIAEATDELRLQVVRMQRERKTPAEFGLYVRSHPDALTVTALNKMYNTETRELIVSYDGKLIETYILPESEEKTRANQDLLQRKFSEMTTSYKYRYDIDGSRSYTIFDIPWNVIRDIIIDFQFHSDLEYQKDPVERYIREIADIYTLWDVGFISIQGGKPQNGFMIASQKRTIGSRHPKSEAGWFTGNKSRFSGSSMFKIGLEDDQIKQALTEAKNANREQPIYRDYTTARQKPLLLFHLLSLMEQDQEPFIHNLPALSISFPNSRIFRTVTYVVNQVWLKQLIEESAVEVEDEDFDQEPLG
jgi:hypothetical protein